MRELLERIAIALEKIAKKPAASVTLMDVSASTNSLARERAAATGGDDE